ncbi:MAG: hypothetical protein JZU47_10125 [Prolixibacteraceae bacterium]|nr:hypothetical protein [Prolixibacteraceae bacterium]
MPEIIKALAIKVQSKDEPSGVKFEWDKIPQLEVFTKNIIIPEISIDKDGQTSVDIGSIVSGMPTVFARADMFKNALDNVTDLKAEATGLMLFYKALINEWKGLISCIALNYANLEIVPVQLTYSDGLNVFETSNIYEPIGAFGNVLFERKKLWCNLTLPEGEQIPAINVIKFNNEVIGGTSPDSFLFTSVSYCIKEKLPFVNNGKFIDPFIDINADLKPDDVAKIYGYAKHILNNINKFEQQFEGLSDSLRPKNYGNISSCIQNWMAEMVNYQEAKRYPRLENQTPPEVGSLFQYPYSLLFNYSTELYGVDGQISSDSSLEGSIRFDPKDLLLPVTTEVAQIRFANAEKREFLRSKPILLLEAETVGQPNSYTYFTLPLTPIALNIFGSQLDALVGLNDNSNVRSRLSAIYDPNNKDGEKLIVTLNLYTLHGSLPITKQLIYNINSDSIKGKDILLWPNFISKQWNRYFMYSEIPHNDVKFQATPFIGDVNDEFFRIILDESGIPIYLAEKGKAITISDKHNNIKVQLHINSNSAVADNAYKYEIYESNQPFKGIKFAYNGINCGFGIIRYDGSCHSQTLPHNMLSVTIPLIDAKLGFDFGSTNSSIAYYSDGNNAISDKIVLENRRVSLFSDDKKNNDERPAVEDEIFFFQNDKIISNSIKSVLTIHDSRRMVNENNISPDSLAAQAVKGGFPCFEKNLPIENALNNRYTLGYTRVGKAELVYNMKWSNQLIDKSHKAAYLSSLLLHVYAQLFIENHVPKSLKWSYPSSMSKDLLTSYQGIWDSLKDVSPIVSQKTIIIYPPSDLNDIGDISSGNSWVNDNNSFPDSDSGWGSSSNEVSTWGTTQELPKESETPGWGDSNPSKNKKLAIEIETETGPIRFDFKQLADDESLTEACAIANYLTRPNGGYTINPGELILCFDIGGSTTDITALCQMADAEGNIGKAMIKQNSIRFAAQRVAEATKFSPYFKSVLLKMCEKKKFKIQGLNTGNNKYNENTAPYFFEQVVDRLDAADFDEFYKLIAADCKEMMSVNLYVTGMIMYYAGQLTHKLRSEIIRSEDAPPAVKALAPKIKIAFAGKGARIFDWFNAVNSKAANDYYTQMFLRGIGGESVARATISPISINPLKIIDINSQKAENNADVKYEVSKGLAIPTNQTKILVPKNKNAIEVLGEEHFCVVTKAGEFKYLESVNSITPEMMECLGDQFICLPPPGKAPCPKFMDFADLFYKVSSSMFGLKMSQTDFMTGFQDMNIENFIKGDIEYAEARKRKNEQKKFDYVAPIIILEGMKFFEKHLMKAIKNS